MKAKLSRLTLFLFILSLCLMGCQDKEGDQPDHNIPQGERSFTFTRGGAPITVYLQLSSAETQITDFLTVTIESHFEEGVLLTPPLLSESVYQPLMLVENPKENTYWSEKDQVMINRWVFKFEPLTSGDFTLKPFAINFRLNKEKPEDPSQWPVYQIHTEEVPYTIIGIETGALEDIRDIKGMILPAYDFIPLFTALGVIFLMAGGYFLVYYLMIKKGTGSDIKAPQVDFYQQTLTRLESLEKRDLISKAQFNAFHTELADILREYVENVFGIRAKEQTTEEFISSFSTSSRFKKDQKQMLDRFLKLADMVKFATFDPGSEISTEALINVRTFVQSTGKQNEI